MSIVDSAADVLWDSVGTINFEERVVEWYPKTHEKWAAARNGAAAESKGPDAVLAVGENVYLACDCCPGLYWIADKDLGRFATPRKAAMSSQ